MKQQQEFAEYLKQGQFEALMQAWKKQFEKIGVLGGVVVVPLHLDNRKDIEDLLGIDTKKKPHIKISWKQFREAISKTRFEDVDFVKVLELYFDSELINSRSKKERQREKTDRFFELLLKTSLDSISSSWLKYVLESKTSVYTETLKAIDQEEQLHIDFLYVIKAIENLPSLSGSQMSIAIFSAKITGDPHAFDKPTRLHFLFTQAIIFYLKDSGFSEMRIDLIENFNRVGLFKEDINNYCGIYGLSAIKEGKHHPGWEGFYQSLEHWNVNLSNVLNIDNIDSKDIKGVLIIENPSIFEVLAKEISEHNLPISLVCSNGQPTQVVFALLDKIEQANLPMLYSGDFDPEGLLIAQRLLDRYLSMSLWLYDEVFFYYQESRNKSSSRRLKMLESLTNPQLRAIGELVEEFGNGYQENMIHLYVNELRKL